MAVPAAPHHLPRPGADAPDVPADVSATEVPRRQVPVTGCFNFRDLGGYRTAGGHRVRWRRLFRADGLAGLGADGVAGLVRLEVVTVLDLRSPGELHARGRFPEVAGIRYAHLPFTESLPGASDAERWSDPGYVGRHYLQLLHDAEPAVVAALRLLAEPDALPAVFHCSVGKDRTGVLAAMVLGLLGVDDAHIVEDYALSRRPMERFLQALRAETAPQVTAMVERYTPVILAAAPESMAAFVAGVRRDFGSFAGWARHAGVGDVAEALRARLLQPG